MDECLQPNSCASRNEPRTHSQFDPALRELLSDSVRLFAGLDDTALDVLLGLSRQTAVKAREMVCRKGEPGEALFIVISGKLKVTNQSEDGRELILAILEDGETFSEMSLLDGQPRSANVMAVQDSNLLVIKRQDFLTFLEQHPKVAIALLVILSKRLREMDSLMGDMRFLDVRSRLAKTLTRLALQHGRTAGNGSIRIDLKLSQEDLGNLICATRESVNKQLKQWESEGVLECSQSSFIIHSIPVLQEIAMG